MIVGQSIMYRPSSCSRHRSRANPSHQRLAMLSRLCGRTVVYRNVSGDQGNTSWTTRPDSTRHFQTLYLVKSMLTYTLATLTPSIGSHSQTICLLTRMYWGRVSRQPVLQKPPLSSGTWPTVCLMLVVNDRNVRSGFTVSRMSQLFCFWLPSQSTINCCSRMRL